MSELFMDNSRRFHVGGPLRYPPSCWLRYQPDSALARWWQRRFARAGGRTRKVAIVALARKLLVALWRYLEHGLVPDGAVLKRRAA